MTLYASLFGQDLQYNRRGIISTNEANVLTPRNIKKVLGDSATADVNRSFKQYRRVHLLKRTILAAETALILNSVDYDTGVPKLNLTSLSIGLSAAAIDLCLRRPLRKRARVFVEQYNYHLTESNFKN
jgi:hypothetical protein